MFHYGSRPLVRRFNLRVCCVLGVYLACSSLLVAQGTVSQASGHDFSGIDDAVRSFPACSSVDELEGHIRAVTTTGWEITRAIYVWLTDNIAYDVKSFFSGRYPDSSPGEVFRTGRSICQGYSELFERLATDRGLQAKTVSGYGKGYGYSPGTHFHATNHAWTAVKLDGTWHLFDATWGAGSVDGKAFVKEYAEAWFGCDPGLFLYWHLPENPEWELVT